MSFFLQVALRLLPIARDSHILVATDNEYLTILRFAGYLFFSADWLISLVTGSRSTLGAICLRGGLTLLIELLDFAIRNYSIRL